MAQKEMYLTHEGLARLESELDHLRNVRRIEVTERLHSAKELTGTEENSDYEDTKTEQSFVEGRILELESILKNPVIIDEHHAEDGRVSIGTRVSRFEMNRAKRIRIHWSGRLRRTLRMAGFPMIPPSVAPLLGTRSATRLRCLYPMARFHTR